MPKFLEKKLAKEYDSEDPSIKYKIMNKMGVMHGNKETEKGRMMDEKHMMDTKEMKKRHKKNHRLNLA